MDLHNRLLRSILKAAHEDDVAVLRRMRTAPRATVLQDEIDQKHGELVAQLDQIQKALDELPSIKPLKPRIHLAKRLALRIQVWQELYARIKHVYRAVK